MKVFRYILLVLAVAMVLLPVAAMADQCPGGGDHEYEAELIRQATNDTEGLRRYTCIKCGDAYDQAIPATGHEWGPWIVDVDPTCTSVGHAYRVCTRHDSNEHIEETIVPALSSSGRHEWVEESREEPTCESQGAVRLRCAVCGEATTEVLPALGHNWEAWETVREPSEGEEGLERRVCAHDASHVEERAIPAISPRVASNASGAEDEDAQQAPRFEPEQIEEPQVNPWAPNALDVVLIGFDAAALIAFALLAAPLLYARRWAAARRRAAHESHYVPGETGRGGRVL